MLMIDGDRTMKYPRTPHVPFSNITDPDDIISNADIFNKKWVVTEKIDGSQVSFEMDGGIVVARNRNTPLLSGSMDRQFHVLPGWIESNYTGMLGLLGDRYIMFGEWMFHVHTVHYDSLPDWFVGFGMFDKVAGSFIPFLDAVNRMSAAGFATVPVLGTVVLRDRKHLESFVKRSTFGSEEMEGVYLHSIDDADRIKYVTVKFKDSVDHARHWRQCTRERNSKA
jgi:ATP-dependent RNA circularization protein (DNA/RNA ligase family)